MITDVTGEERDSETGLGKLGDAENSGTSMIRACQGKTHLSPHSKERPEAPKQAGRAAERFAFCDPLRIGSTHQRQRDQTSICGNGARPSTKIEFEGKLGDGRDVTLRISLVEKRTPVARSKGFAWADDRPS